MNALTPIALLTILAVCITTCARAVAADLSGTYSGNQIKLELSAASGDRYTAMIFFGGQQYPATVVDTGNGCVGTFETQGQHFRFELRPGAAGGFTLVSDGAQYPLTREGGAAAAPANPLAKPADA